MSTINVSNLILALQQKIDSSTNEADFLYYSKAIQQLRTGHIFVVNNLSNLPNFEQNLGSLYYVINDETIYFSSSFGWIAISTSTVGILFSWGRNQDGRLADGTVDNKSSPVREFCLATDWCQVSAGGDHTAALKTSGQIWSWGHNNYGGLSDGTATSRCSPVREFCSTTDWCQVSAGWRLAAAIKTSGEMWVWGRNACGALGDGTVTNRCSPVREFCSATDWCQVNSGNGLTAAIKTSGELWSWGINNCGQLGDGSITNRCSPIREICSATDWCQVSAGRFHMVALKTSGQIWSWGASLPLGDGTSTNKCSPVREFCSATDWCQVSAGNLNTAAIKTSGELWVWGINSCGQLGDGNVAPRCSPVREFCSATDWCQVSAGCYHTAALKTSGQIWSWGTNSSCQLGDGTGRPTSCSPVREFSSSTNWCQVSAGECHTAAIQFLQVS